MSSQSLESILCHNNPPLRQRRQRTNFDDDAIARLEEAFSKNPYPDINERESMAKEFKTTEDRIQVWFQNKRARYRKRVQKENKSNVENVKPGPRKRSTTVLDSTPTRNLLTDKTNSSTDDSAYQSDLSQTSMYSPVSQNGYFTFIQHSTPFNSFYPSYQYFQSPICNASLFQPTQTQIKPTKLFRPFE